MVDPKITARLSLSILLLVAAFPLTTAATSSGPGDAPFTGDTLPAYLEQALTENPELKGFRARHDAAMERVTTVGTLPDPRLQVTHFVEAIQTRTGTQENAFIVTQMIPWFGKLGRQQDVASAEAEALWYMVLDRQLGLAREVGLAFFDYGYTAKAIDLTGENLSLLQRLEPVVEERVRGGGDLNALLRLQVETARMDDRLQTLGQQRRAQSARLAAMLAVHASEPLPWPTWEAPEPQRLDAQALAVAIEANNPTLAMLDRKVASAEARRALVRYESYPDLTLAVNYIQLDRYAGSTITDAGRDPWGIMVGVNLPIWAGRNDAVRAEAESDQTAARYERRDREFRLKGELSAALSRNDDANRRLKLYGEDLLGLAQQALEITQSGYESGKATILDVIDSERSLLELQLQYWRAAADAWQSRIMIQTLTNQPVAGFAVADGKANP